MTGKTKALDFLSVNIAPVAGHWRRSDSGDDTNLPPHNGLGRIVSEDRRNYLRVRTHPDAICADDEVGGDRSTVGESDGAGVVIDALASGMEVIVLDTYKRRTVSRVINDELAWDAFASPRGRGVKKTFVHVLTVE